MTVERRIGSRRLEPEASVVFILLRLFIITGPERAGGYGMLVAWRMPPDCK